MKRTHTRIPAVQRLAVRIVEDIIQNTAHQSNAKTVALLDAILVEIAEAREQIAELDS